MKQLLLILITLCISHVISAQKNFEGSVTYRLHSNQGEKPDAELKVLFGTRKLKVMFKERDEFEKEVLVINLDSATVYNVNFDEKTFKKTTLILTGPAQKPEKRLINGYSTTPLLPENTGLGGLLGGMLGTSNVVFYLADSLYYHIPGAFTGNKELLMIQQNRIVLGADIQIINPFSELADSSSKKNNIITAEAIDIKPMAIDQNEFLIPVDFVNRKDIPIVTEEKVAAEDTMVVIDTVPATPPSPAKRAVKRKPAKPGVPKSKSATKATLRKE
jgi:hypothetical protein